MRILIRRPGKWRDVTQRPRSITVIAHSEREPQAYCAGKWGSMGFLCGTV
jgi:hypothetical protein